MKLTFIGALGAVVALALPNIASATPCSSACDHDYSVCNAQNGGSAQQTCMPKWMQCKKTCTGAAKAQSVKAANQAPPRP